MRVLTILEGDILRFIDAVPGMTIDEILHGCRETRMPAKVREVVFALVELGLVSAVGGGTQPVRYRKVYGQPAPKKTVSWTIEEGEYNRVFKIDGLEVLVNYTTHKNDGTVTDKAIKLDSQIIPAIKAGLRLQNDAFELLGQILTRLDLEAKQKGEGAEFPCAAMRDSIRKLLTAKFGKPVAPGVAILSDLAKIIRGHGHSLNATATREERSQFISEVIELYNYKVIEFLTGEKIKDPRPPKE